MSEITKIELPIFGEINMEQTDMSDWEYRYEAHLQKHIFNGMEVDISVHFRTLNKTAIEEVGQALENMNKINALGIAAFTENYKAGGESERYIREWSEDIFQQIFNVEYLAGSACPVKGLTKPPEASVAWL